MYKGISEIIHMYQQLQPSRGPLQFCCASPREQQHQQLPATPPPHACAPLPPASLPQPGVYAHSLLPPPPARTCGDLIKFCGVVGHVPRRHHCEFARVLWALDTLAGQLARDWEIPGSVWSHCQPQLPPPPLFSGARLHRHCQLSISLCELATCSPVIPLPPPFPHPPSPPVSDDLFPQMRLHALSTSSLPRSLTSSFDRRIRLCNLPRNLFIALSVC